MNTKLMAIAVVAVVMVGAVAAFTVLRDKPDPGVEDRGWYGWNPKTVLVSSSNLALSPFWPNTIEYIYGEIYGDISSHGTYTIDDVPDDFYPKKNTLVDYNDAGKLVVTSWYYEAGVWKSFDVTFDKQATGGIASGSQFICLYYVLCAAYDVDPMDYDPAVVEKFWSYALGGDGSLFEPRFETTYGIPVAGFNGGELGNPSLTLNSDPEKHVALVGKLVAEGEVPVWICSGSMPAYENGGKVIRDIMEDSGFYSVTFQTGTFYDCLSMIEAIAHIFGYGDYADAVIDTLRVKMYTLYKASEATVEEQGFKYTALATYTNSDYVMGKDSATGGDMFFILNLDNVYTLSTSGNWDGEYVIAAAPQVIIFTMSDISLVDWNQAMRVPG